MTFTNQVSSIISLQANRLGGTLIFYALQQIIISLGITTGFTFLYADIDKSTILYLATGAPTMIFVTCGLACLPMQNSTAKTEGHLNFLKTLPVNRLSIVIADTVIWLAVSLPGIIISTLSAHFIFRPGYSFSWLVIPSCLLAALTCIAIGYGFSYVLKPETTLVVCMLCVFGALMFSPINFPMDRLPAWMQVVHNILPIDSMAQIIRSTFAGTMFSVDFVHYIKLSLWCVAGYGVVAIMINKK